MSNFSKVTQDKNDKIQVFAIKLKGVLNQIRSRFPAKIGKKEVQGHLREWLIHGMKRTLRDSLCSQYDEPNLSYTDLFLVACEAESEECDSRVTNSASTVKVKQPK